jgi:hypothetical protein
MRALALISKSIRIKESTFKPKNTVYYDYDRRQEPLHQCERLLSNSTIDTLLFTGTHGNFESDPRILNGIPENDVVRLSNILKRKGTKSIKNIVMDCCDSAYFIPHFKDNLHDDGIIYCNLSDGRQHNVINLFKDYPLYKDLTLGIAMFNLVSMMNHADRNIGDNVLTYPAVYAKRSNTLYYHGQANRELIENLRSKGITVTEVRDFNSYLDKLLISRQPLEEEVDKILLNSDRLSDWDELCKTSRTKKPVSTLSNRAIEEKLLRLLAESFKSKKNFNVRDCTKIAFPLAKRLARQGTDPISILARAACQYQQKHLNPIKVNLYYKAIATELQCNFATYLLTVELQKQLKKTPYPNDAQWRKIKSHLERYGEQILDSYQKKHLTSIMNEVMPEKSDVKISSSILAFHWINSCLKASMVGASVGLALYSAQFIAITFSLTTIGLAALAVSSVYLLKNLIQHKLKTSGLSEYENYKPRQISLMDENRLKSFIDGTQTSMSQRINSVFTYRDWRHMRDYYAGQCANETHQEGLIQKVRARLRG